MLVEDVKSQDEEDYSRGVVLDSWQFGRRHHQQRPVDPACLHRVASTYEACIGGVLRRFGYCQRLERVSEGRLKDAGISQLEVLCKYRHFGNGYSGNITYIFDVMLLKPYSKHLTRELVIDRSERSYLLGQFGRRARRWRR